LSGTEDVRAPGDRDRPFRLIAEDARCNAVAIDVLSFSPINFCRTDGTNAAHGDKIPVFRK
jgi:hypothetical protein